MAQAGPKFILRSALLWKSAFKKNNKTQPQTNMETTVTSYPIYKGEVWGWLSLYAYLSSNSCLGRPTTSPGLARTDEGLLPPPPDPPPLFSLQH